MMNQKHRSWSSMFAVILALPDVCEASSFGCFPGPTPEQVMDEFLSPTGPAVRFAAAASIIVFGLLLAVVDLKPRARRVCGVMLGIMIVVCAISLATDLLSPTSGAAF